MDILTALEAAHSPLTLSELQEYCGVMFSQQRLESLIRSGDVKHVPDLPDVFWSVPAALKKQNTMKRLQPPLKPSEREKYLTDIHALRDKLSSVSFELDALRLQKDQFPTQEQLTAHMNRLHAYNDMKDIGQLIIGHLAEVEKCKVQKLYERYGIDQSE
jgi:hypothetical protein